jgi:hypothetical protein
VGEGKIIMNFPESRILIYRFWQILVVAGLPPALWLIANTLLTPFSPINLYTPYEAPFKLFSGFIIAPLTIVLGIICVRRAKSNIVGLMLILLGYGTVFSSLSHLNHINLDPIYMLLTNYWVGWFWVSFLLIPVYFPNGRISPPGFERWGNRIVFLAILIWHIQICTTPNLIVGFADKPLAAVPNPIYIAALAFLTPFNPGLIMIFTFIIIGGITMVLRYRQGTMRERLQLRWMLAAFVAIFAVTFISDATKIPNLSRLVVPLFATFVYPASIAYAILRHRLYDIDIIIRRTLIYSVLTGILAVVYFGGVIITQQLFQAVTGDTPDIAIVLSTLLIAALFNPLRSRIQDVIDRRLYRRKYDVEQTIAQFNQSLRDEVDVKMLQANLIGVVSETMQPDKIALWINPKTQVEKVNS